MSQLFNQYRVEGLTMPYTLQDFKRELVRENLTELTPAERLAGLSTEEILKQLPAEEIEAYLKGLGKKPTPPKKKRKGRS